VSYYDPSEVRIRFAPKKIGAHRPHMTEAVADGLAALGDFLRALGAAAETRS